MPTYGSAGQPSASTFNYDALVATSVANYRKTFTDNISTSNIFFKKLKDKDMWESADGGLYIAEDLMYGLAPTDSYDGYDELPLTPSEGITQAQYPWRQLATPIAISEKERKMNKHRIVDLVAAKIMQAEISMQEAWAKYFLQGQLADGGVGNLYTAKTSPVNGSSAFDPLGSLVMYNPALSLSPGGIDQSTQTWWRNQSTASISSTYIAFIQEVLNLFNSCSKGPGGTPDFGISDQVTWEQLSVAYYQRYRTEATQVGDYPFPVLKFQGVEIGWDQFMPDVAAGTVTATEGSLYFLNSKFLKIRYEAETNFVTSDFKQPVNQDAKFKHILWMGNATTNNRRKLGVMGSIQRSMS